MNILPAISQKITRPMLRVHRTGGAFSSNRFPTWPELLSWVSDMRWPPNNRCLRQYWPSTMVDHARGFHKVCNQLRQLRSVPEDALMHAEALECKLLNDHRNISCRPPPLRAQDSYKDRQWTLWTLITDNRSVWIQVFLLLCFLFTLSTKNFI